MGNFTYARANHEGQGVCTVGHKARSDLVGPACLLPSSRVILAHDH